MPLLHQLVVKLDVVVNFSVKADRQRTVFVIDRLPSPFQVDDRKPPHPHEKAMRFVLVRTSAIRSPMSEAVSHPGQEPILNKAREAKYSAHRKRCAYALTRPPSNKLTAADTANRGLQSPKNEIGRAP